MAEMDEYLNTPEDFDVTCTRFPRPSQFVTPAGPTPEQLESRISEALRAYSQLYETEKPMRLWVSPSEFDELKAEVASLREEEVRLRGPLVTNTLDVRKMDTDELLARLQEQEQA